jgi:phosphoserine phosphatase
MKGTLERFDPDIQRRLDERIRKGPGLAVFDADHTLWCEDSGETFYQWLIAGRHLKDVDYTLDLFAEYRALEKVDENAAYVKLITDMAGLPEPVVQDLCRDFFPTFVQNCFPAMRDLVRDLLAAGWDVRIVTAASRWLVQAGCHHFGLAPDCVIGVDLHVENGVLTRDLAYDFPYGPGKVKAIQRFIGHRPHLAAGDSAGDLYMLETAQDLALVLAYDGYEKQRPLLDAARARGWLVQRIPARG